MLIDLKQLFDLVGEKYIIDCQSDLSSYELFNEFPFINPIQANGIIENKAGMVILNATIKFSLKLSCDRCLDPFTRDYTFEVEHVLVNSQTQSDEDYIMLESYHLDLDELILSDILLNLPSKLLCSDDCKGLCSMCGANRNITKCDCKDKTVDPRLAVLGELLK